MSNIITKNYHRIISGWVFTFSPSFSGCSPRRNRKKKGFCSSRNSSTFFSISDGGNS